VLEAEPVEFVVPVVAGALALVVVAAVVVVVGAVVAEVLDVPALVAVANCVRAASSAVYSLPPPPCTPLVLESESPLVGLFLEDDWGVPSKDERLMAEALEIALVDISHSVRNNPQEGHRPQYVNL
jgi:hypothetical protein